ncbi:MAG: hypothetical protein J0I32_00150 [Sphingobacteriales bacterium]|nr:hypothetical protein [Sphingobacteriales bacterium]OJW04469.1 MAG: hypothetical protein BGO52_18230 [Sphingobacteriales bacterium 44-61]
MKFLQISILIGLYIHVISFGCTTQQRSIEPPVRALKCSLGILLMNDKGEHSDMKSSFLLYEYEDYRIFQIPVELTQSDIFIDKNGDFIRDSAYSVGTAYRYIINKKGANHDQYYFHVDSLPRLTAVDSFLKQQTVYNMQTGLANLFATSRLVSSEWSEGKKALFEQYLTTMKRDSTYADSTILYYRKDLDDYVMSLSNRLDSAKGIKLSLVRLIYRRWPLERYAGRAQQKEILVGIEPVGVENKADILKLVEKFEKYEKD